MRFKDHITENLLAFGIMPKLSGFKYLREAIRQCFLDESLLRNLVNRLYPSVAKVFNTSSAIVERNMRNALDNAYRNGGFLYLNDYFNSIVYTMDYKMTNGEFLALVVLKIKLDILENAFNDKKNEN